ncbi:MAG: hypothetical protein RLZZ540_1774 [Bacteroidota bacterium]|jgi:hypothetical protein
MILKQLSKKYISLKVYQESKKEILAILGTFFSTSFSILSNHFEYVGSTDKFCKFITVY